MLNSLLLDVTVTGVKYLYSEYIPNPSSIKINIIYLRQTIRN